MNWYFVRHGEIESNLKKIYAGWSQEGLTQKGIQQTEKAAKDLVGLGIDAIYCSPIQRGIETAKIIGRILQKRPILENSFKEMRLGPWEGRSEQEIRKKFPGQWKTWNSRPAELILTGRETLPELLKRVLSGIKEMREQMDGSSVLVVTHVAIIRVLLLHAQKMDLNLYRTIPVPNGKIFEIDNKLLN